MVDPRTPIFDAIKTAGGRFATQALVDRLHAVLNDAGVPRSDGTNAPTAPVSYIDASLLAVVCPGISSIWAGPIVAACRRFQINTIRRIAAFIAQMAHESACFTQLTENLNYTSAARIAQVWPARFTLAGAALYVHNPQKLANYVYANRLGNGPPESGDGFKYRGVAPLQVTGKANWRAFAVSMNMPLEEALTYGQTVEGGVMASAWFWEVNDINRLADTPGVSDETRRINGSLIGLQDRTDKFNALVTELLKREAA